MGSRRYQMIAGSWNTLLFPWCGLWFVALEDTEAPGQGRNEMATLGFSQVEEVFMKCLDD